MQALYDLDDRINWAAVAGALCLWDVYAKYSGRRSASRWFRAHPIVRTVFLLALTNHLTRRDVS
jgi:hypothetical protein